MQIWRLLAIIFFSDEIKPLRTIAFNSSSMIYCQVFCHQKFPRCDDYKLQIQWHVNDTRNCLDAIKNCSSKAKETLHKMKICQKLSKGSDDINQCKFGNINNDIFLYKTSWEDLLSDVFVHFGRLLFCIFLRWYILKVFLQDFFCTYFCNVL